MSHHPTFDPELFQKLLASAFAVQESGMKSQSLAAIVELERSLRSGQVDADGAMHLIAEWARTVASASGVVIGRLQGDQLVYGAGSGSAASYVGRRVMAIFSPSTPNESRQEILRVENLEAVGGIEAAICRQFGVKSLLILPIFCGRAVTGVLQVLFHEAHAFQDQELCTYRLLAELAGEAMSQSAENESLHAQASSEKFPAPIRQPLHWNAPAPAARKGAVCKSCGAPIAETGEIPAIERSRQVLSGLLQRIKEVPLPTNSWRAGLAAAGVLVGVTWILFTGRQPITSSLSASPPPKTASTEQPPSGAGTGLASTQRPSSSNASLPKAVGPVAREVTVRHFASKPASQTQAQVKYFGDDVTVRYFAPKFAAVRTAAAGDVRQVSDDVTVRYFRPQNTGVQSPPMATGAPQPVNR